VNVRSLRRCTIVHSSPSGADVKHNGTHSLRAFACAWLCEGRASDQQQFVAQEELSHKLLVRVRIDPDRQIVALFNQID
jgi:hypothetical protein